VGAPPLLGSPPRLAGKPAGPARGNRAKNKAVVNVGGARVRYAGPIFYGWPRHGIRAAGTIPRTDAVMADRAPLILDQELTRIFLKYGFE
jgi:hypothetical protein